MERVPPLDKHTNIQEFMDAWTGSFFGGRFHRFLVYAVLYAIKQERTRLEFTKVTDLGEVQGKVAALRSTLALLERKDIREPLERVIERYGR